MLRALWRGCGRLIVISGTSWRVVEGAKRRQEGGTGVSTWDGGYNHLYFSATCRYSSTVSFARSCSPLAGSSRGRAPLGQPWAPPSLPSWGGRRSVLACKINYFLDIYLYKLNLFERAFCANSCMLEIISQCSKIRGPFSGYRNEVRRCTATSICTGTPYMYICLSKKNCTPVAVRIIPAPSFSRPKRALRNHADCLRSLEIHLASRQGVTILLNSAGKILARGKALQEL